MNNLLHVNMSSDRVAITQTNMERLDASEAFEQHPTGGTENFGPPTTGDWKVGQKYLDVNLATFRCTVAGTPGTWIQIAPAVVSANPVVTGFDGYVIARTAEWLKLYRWNDGGAAWAAV